MGKRVKALEVREFGGEEFWTPFSVFRASESDLLHSWADHYRVLGIACHVCVERKLWVHIGDDVGCYSRQLGLTV